MFKILIADPRRVVRAGLSAAFANTFVEQIVESTTLEDVNRQVAMSSLSLIFIHQSLLSNMKVLQQVPCVVLVSEPNMSQLHTVFQHQARGYLSENASVELLHMTLKLEDNTFLIDPAIASWLLTMTCTQKLSLITTEMLTAREDEVFMLMHDGYTNYEISQKLCISLTTVKKHAASISQKLNLKRRSIKILALPYRDTPRIHTSALASSR